MCRVLLIRHAEHPLNGEALVGRDNHALHLSEHGMEQARELAEALLEEDIGCIQSSPRLRCLETAAPLADMLRLPVLVYDALDEVNFGDWTGARFDDLANDAKWYSWNVSRARTRAPGGETMAEARTRALRHMDRTVTRYPGAPVAMFTHAEIIRAIRLHLDRRSLNSWQSVEVPLASVTALDILPDAMPEKLLEAAS